MELCDNKTWGLKCNGTCNTCSDHGSCDPFSGKSTVPPEHSGCETKRGARTQGVRGHNGYILAHFQVELILFSKARNSDFFVPNFISFFETLYSFLSLK